MPGEWRAALHPPTGPRPRMARRAAVPTAPAAPTKPRARGHRPVATRERPAPQQATRQDPTRPPRAARARPGSREPALGPAEVGRTVAPTDRHLEKLDHEEGLVRQGWL